MNQRLSISNFGPIKEVTLDVNDVLVFIGSQASGKSTISKAIFFFKSLRDDLTSYLYQAYERKHFENSISDFAKRAKQKFLKIYGPVLQFTKMRLMYQYGNKMEVIVKPSEDNRFTDIQFNKMFQDKFCDLMERARLLNEEVQQQSLQFSSSREISKLKAKEASLFEEIEDEANKLFNDNRDLLFLPAGRSLIATLSQQRYNIDLGNEWTSSEDHFNLKLDYLMQNFINRIDNAKPLFNQAFPDFIQEHLSKSHDSQNRDSVDLAQRIVNSILKGSYRYQDGVEKIDFGEGYSTLINFASSGQQEVVWILLLILLLIIEQRNVFLVVEEPEAHLFPVAQKEMVDLLALLSNQGDNQVIVTTHSPYILSSFNNLLYAHTLGLEKVQAVENIVDRQLWVDPNRINAFILEEGSIRSILDSEINLIESAEIDRASDVIVDTFNKLFDLED
ncbi:MAG: AAA family ATPase [Xenococcus sp. (in: cyanobacteria)]